MTNGTDLNNLRAILDEYEDYVGALGADNRNKTMIAEAMRAVIAEARLALHASSDGTANFIDARQILERLNTLRTKAETP
jgi:hypothetical protein